MTLKTHHVFTEMRKLPATEGNPENNQQQNNNQQQTTSRNITISVVDSVDNTNKIASASIKEDGTEIGTTGIGGGQATISNVTDGQHTLTISATGYTTKTETITVGSGNTSFTIELVAE